MKAIVCTVLPRPCVTSSQHSEHSKTQQHKLEARGIRVVCLSTVPHHIIRQDAALPKCILPACGANTARPTANLDNTDAACQAQSVMDTVIDMGIGECFRVRDT